MKKNKIITFGFAALMLVACKPKYTKPDADAGEINTARFVMIGGSHTAGYMDDALYYEGQEASIANLIALQLQTVGGSTFNQPYVASASVGANTSGKSKLILGYKTDCLGVTSLSPVRFATSGDVAAFGQNVYNAGQLFGNFGVPGLTVTAVNFPNYGNSGAGTYNPYFARMNSGASASVLGDAMASNPTSFALFLGIEDYLIFAQTGTSAGSMTSTANFALAYENAVQTLTASGAKGVVSLIPDISETPYFTTIPWNGLNLTPEKAASLNGIYNPIGISFQVGANGFVIQDPSAGAFGVRKLVEGECVLLSTPLDSVKCNAMGSISPLRNEFILTAPELTQIRAQIAEYNTAILSIAATYNLAVAHTDEVMHKLVKGFAYNGFTMSAKFVSGGAYSLDGIHFNPRGNAIIANEFIRALNVKYAAKIPAVNAINYRSTLFP